MSYFNHNRILYWIIAILAVFSLSLLASVFFHYNQEERKSKSLHPAPEQQQPHMLMQQLNLAPEQEKIFDQDRHQYMIEARSIMDNLNQKRNEFIQELTVPEPDTIRLQQIADSIGRLHVELKMATLHHFMKLKSICNPEQQKTLNEMFRHFVQKEDRMPGAGKGHGHKVPMPQSCPWMP